MIALIASLAIFLGGLASGPAVVNRTDGGDLKKQVATRASAPVQNQVPKTKLVPVQPPAPRLSVLNPPPTALRPDNIEDILCSAQVVSEDPSEVLQIISQQTKTNLVLLSNPATKLTLNLTNVRLGEMIRHICALTQLNFLKVGTTFVLATEAQLRAAYPIEWAVLNPPPAPPAGVVTEVYRANYVSSFQIAEALEKLFGKEKLSAVAGPIQSNPSVANRDTAGTTGVTSNLIQSEQQASDSARKLLVLRGDPETVSQALSLAKQMDTPRPQVGIEVTIYDISNTALKDLGLTWNFGNLSVTENAHSGLRLGSFSRAPQTFSAILSALQKNDNAKILASPNISVLDGERAFILIGDRINYPVLVGYSQANTPIFNKETERVGIYLQVAASVSSDDNITLSLYPQVSSVTGFLEVNGASYPQISTREAQTTLRMLSGETVVLGGLLKSEEIAQVERFPILSDIPVLGELFKRRKRTKVESQVIISIKPILLKIDEHR